MAKFYRMLFLEHKDLGVARTPKTQRFVLPYRGRVEGWLTLSLDLVEGDYPDYLASNLGCRLCSLYLKNILTDNASTEDEIQWLDVKVRRATEERDYFILHFPNPPDVLDRIKTIYAGGDFVVKPVLKGDIAINHRVFAYPRNEGLPLFVVEAVKRKVETAGCSGVEFSRLQVV